jgi:hypothetical protein
MVRIQPQAIVRWPLDLVLALLSRLAMQASRSSRSSGRRRLLERREAEDHAELYEHWVVHHPVLLQSSIPTAGELSPPSGVIPLGVPPGPPARPRSIVG